jgi:hypothetical protein
VLQASANALTYEDADHSATTRPTMNRAPAAPRLEVIDSIGPWNVFAVGSGPSCVTVSVSTRLTPAGLANSPTSDTITSRAGKIASTA